MKLATFPAHEIQTATGPSRAPELSFVIPAYNEEANIAETIRRVDDEARTLVRSHEIIIVDDGSSDKTFERTKETAGDVPIHVLRLSRNFGKEQAIMAGLEASTGAGVVILDADLQEPLCHLATMLQHRAEGFEVVYAVRAHRDDEPYLKRLFTRVFYKLLNLGSEADIPPDARDFRLMDRRVVDALCNLPERNRFMKGLYGWVGFRSKAIPIELEQRAGGTSKFGFRSLLKLGLTGMTSFTSWPLRVWTLIGMSVAALSILYGLWIAAKTMIFGIDVPGWSTLAVAVFLLGGVQLISIGVLGEYLARVFTEVKGRPGFIIAETHNQIKAQR
ncbi:glycosyltransferase family 2 protein [Phaeobacter gallaeciensis]|uniref:glycosyltransferase family 2 protein n=1 Tax=Rhodobacterales TaxID=204455 RepID=UPI00237F05E3|nr:glycosyltransferase family 2 protein [Phaeobacter gallaeciensis]MDF1774360.1 glycosyltransferase family 2 protein [Pseudophaeobacter sp. bin_em_oilr2.035]MDE4193455.1 glycosyltransferase family 2 protein [Phaeobacter gallaeciensis]MDE4201696.1 glycosyltransferase family 2 protein [Phaeobacter gallaeciensis]MDE4205879.1 glycosyltransferase family 2 protein [Phaeobacter gallaeciensis]MDE4210041.1 glycosyltransferase family 2 protein [Phaeobacter gallaeciensis]